MCRNTKVKRWSDWIDTKAELHQPKNRKYDELCSGSAKPVTFPIVCMPTLSHLTWLVLQTALPCLAEPVFCAFALFLLACSCACIYLYNFMSFMQIYYICGVPNTLCVCTHPPSPHPHTLMHTFITTIRPILCCDWKISWQRFFFAMW